MSCTTPISSSCRFRPSDDWHLWLRRLDYWEYEGGSIRWSLALAHRFPEWVVAESDGRASRLGRRDAGWHRRAVLTCMVCTAPPQVGSETYSFCDVRAAMFSKQKKVWCTELHPYGSTDWSLYGVVCFFFLGLRSSMLVGNNKQWPHYFFFLKHIGTIPQK